MKASAFGSLFVDADDPASTTHCDRSDSGLRNRCLSYSIASEAECEVEDSKQ